MSARWVSRRIEYATPCSSHQGAIHGPPVLFSLLEFLRQDGPENTRALRQRLADGNQRSLCQRNLSRVFSDDLASGRLDLDLDHTTPPWPGVMIGWPTGGIRVVRARDRLETSPVSRCRARLRHCTDLALTVAVLSRCKSQLYLGHRQPAGSLVELAARALIFDDERAARLDCLAVLEPLGVQPAGTWRSS